MDEPQAKQRPETASGLEDERVVPNALPFEHVVKRVMVDVALSREGATKAKAWT